MTTANMSIGDCCFTFMQVLGNMMTCKQQSNDMSNRARHYFVMQIDCSGTRPRTSVCVECRAKLQHGSASPGPVKLQTDCNHLKATEGTNTKCLAGDSRSMALQALDNIVESWPGQSRKTSRARLMPFIDAAATQRGSSLEMRGSMP